MKKSDMSSSVAEATQHLNAEVVDDKGGKGGLLNRIPGYITQELCDVLDIFVLAPARFALSAPRCLST